MSVLIEVLTISNFRALETFAVQGLGRVNLLTGKNNSGKSTVLEAIRILASAGSPMVLFDILDSREELASPTKGNSPESGSSICNLFNGFPDLFSNNDAFEITAKGTIPAAYSLVQMRLGLADRIVDQQSQIIRYEQISTDLFGSLPKDGFRDSEAVPVVEITTKTKKSVRPVSRIIDLPRAIPVSEVPTFPCVHLNPSSTRSSEQTTALWDAIALTDVEDEVVRALQIVAPEITAVSMIGDDVRADSRFSRRSRLGRIAIAKSVRYRTPVPLKTFGDGVSRIFGVILSLCNARDGILLIDEIENGIHYNAQPDLWKTIFRLARTLNVQVFATTHSWDCVQAFQAAAQESPDDGSLVRLNLKDGRVRPTVFTKDELRIVTRDHIEVR